MTVKMAENVRAVQGQLLLEAQQAWEVPGAYRLPETSVGHMVDCKLHE